MINNVTSFQLDISEKRKWAVGIFFYIIVTPVLLFFAWYRLDEGYIIYAAILFSIVILFTIITTLIYRGFPSGPLYRILSFSIVLFFSAILIMGRLLDNYTAWIIIYPLFVFYMFGKHEGIIWSAIFLIIIGFLSLCRDPLLHTEPLPKSYVLRFMITYAIVMSMTYAYEIVRQYYQDMMELKHDLLMKEKEKLSILARTDYLTKLSNRQYITELIAYERGRAKRSNKSYSIAIGDIDNFKAVNDSYGHDCGDMVLKKIADIMRSTVRHQDYVARWGGEEFLLLLPETDSIGAQTVAEKIRAEIENVSFQCLGSSFSITMSFGVSQLHGIAEDMQETIKNADRALYRAKNAGKNIVIIDD